MALLDSELARCKAELGYNLLTVGAEPMISVYAIFEQVIQPYMSSGAITTSSTEVTASTGAPVTLALDSATGFAENAIVVADIGPRQERTQIQSLSGADITVWLEKDHTGTYPVTVEGGESIVRDMLKKIADCKDSMSKNYGAGSLKQVDEISFHGTGGRSYFDTLEGNLMYWRDELASYLGIPNMYRVKRDAGCRMSVY